ncbi:flagellar motor protein MotB [Croceicoccus marinus]|uniref:OmpA family protein n=1 Tax=Croceicoccus marinus TaxID=450378 RepID=A0A7G6VQZ0_9SPHN|nr:flagellar motor protein MotB [Croceicoccus marinus]QNE04155.1 OmpA family protein [Croceicoccus marinus]
MASAPVDPGFEGRNSRPIIVKKVTVVAGGHHGGAWKVAYADFVTAMMAFFLLLWLLNATTEEQKQGLADYFAPTLVQMRENSAGSNGLLGGASLSQMDSASNGKADNGHMTIAPARDSTGQMKRSEETRRAVERMLRSTPQLRRLARQVRLVPTLEGIRMDLVDDSDFAMFHLGTTVLTPDARALLGAIAGAAAAQDTQMTLRGHTDALPWRDGVPGNNWSLSAGRAEATRLELLRGGIAKSRFARIEGVADREPLIADNPEDPRNRRISITVLD